MDEIFSYLSKVFNKNGFRLYMIGSSSRDYLLNREIFDYDFVTNATPVQIKNFLDVNDTFSRFGVVKYKYESKTCDIATLRKEGEYNDHRHPDFVEFIDDIYVDYLRRDFTINAIYIDENYNVIDPANGVKDLKERVLRFIGDPIKRVKEDPLRILRAKRFVKEYNLDIDGATFNALADYEYLIDTLNQNKVKEEVKKGEKV